MDVVQHSHHLTFSCVQLVSSILVYFLKNKKMKSLKKKKKKKKLSLNSRGPSAEAAPQSWKRFIKFELEKAES